MSTSIIIHRKNGVGRLSFFDDTDDISMSEIKTIAARWSHFFDEKIEVIETKDRKCYPNFTYTER